MRRAVSFAPMRGLALIAAIVAAFALAGRAWASDPSTIQEAAPHRGPSVPSLTPGEGSEPNWVRESSDSQLQPRHGEAMQTGARNQLAGTIKSVTQGAVMAEVVVDVNGIEVVVAITKNSVDRLQLAEGKQVSAIVKATDVMIATD